MCPEFRARTKQAAVAWADLGAEDMQARQQEAEAAVRAAASGPSTTCGTSS